jgi:hypothetical protein
VEPTHKLQNSLDVGWDSRVGFSADDGQIGVLVAVGEKVHAQKGGDLSNSEISGDDVLVQVGGEV